MILASTIAVSVYIGAGKHGAPPVGTTANLRRVLAASSIAVTFATLDGIVGMAGEYRIGTGPGGSDGLERSALVRFGSTLFESRLLSKPALARIGDKFERRIPVIVATP